MSYHHFKGDSLSRAEKMQRKVVELLFKSKLSDEKRESSRVWELKHSSSCCQVGRILAEKRGLDIELAEVICALHDIHVVMHGGYKDHAKKGAVIAKDLLEESGEFSETEIKTIVDAIAHHSEKEIKSDHPYIELAKDADVFDCSLYEGVDEDYRLHKAESVREKYIERIRHVREELGLPSKKVFR